MINAINASKDTSIAKQKNCVLFVVREGSTMPLRNNVTASRIRHIFGTIKHAFNALTLISLISPLSHANPAQIMRPIT